MALVGSLFVPAVIEFGVILRDESVLSQSCILDILLITFYKVSQILPIIYTRANTDHQQNIVPVLQPALKTLLDVALFIEREGSADNRISGLAVVQTALDRMKREDLVGVIP